jgi:hypothetical protein
VPTTILLLKFISSGILMGLVMVCIGFRTIRFEVITRVGLGIGLGEGVIVMRELGTTGWELLIFLFLRHKAYMFLSISMSILVSISPFFY